MHANFGYVPFANRVLPGPTNQLDRARLDDLRRLLKVLKCSPDTRTRLDLHPNLWQNNGQNNGWDKVLRNPTRIGHTAGNACGSSPPGWRTSIRAISVPAMPPRSDTSFRSPMWPILAPRRACQRQCTSQCQRAGQRQRACKRRWLANRARVGLQGLGVRQLTGRPCRQPRKGPGRWIGYTWRKPSVPAGRCLCPPVP